MAVRAEFVNPFLTGAIVAFRAELGQTPALGQVTATLESPDSQGITVLIGLSGQLRGVVAYDMEEKTAKAMASAMAGVPMPIFDTLCESAIAELGNIITGQAGARLEEGGHQVWLTPPWLVTGRGTRLEMGGRACLMVPLDLPLGTVRVCLAVEAD